MKMDSLSSEEFQHEWERFEELMLFESIPYVGKPLSPNFGWYTKRRAETYEKELELRFADWKRNCESLAKFGLNASVDYEISRIRTFKTRAKTSTFLLSDSHYDQAFAFYKQIAEERLRLGAEIINLDYQLAGLLKAATLRNSLGGHVDIGKAGTLKQALMRWRDAYNNGLYVECIKLEKSAKKTVETLKEAIYAQDSKSSVIYPGTSFKSAGALAFGGNEQTLLNTNVKNSSLFLSNKKELKLYRSEQSYHNWEVSFDLVNSRFQRVELGSGSWTYAQRHNFYTNMSSDKEEKVDCYWSSLAPGILFDTASSTIDIVDKTLGVPLAPDMIAGVFDGNVKLFKQGQSIPAAAMSEGWLLVMWNENNNAPKLPVLMFFENKPDSIKWSLNGFEIERQSGLGKYAVATLYGAAAQAADWGTGWEAVPADVIQQCRKMARHLAIFPLDMDEFYAIDNGRVRIWNVLTKTIDLSKNWALEAPAYIPVPPLYTFGAAGDAPIEFEQALSEPLVPTRFGFYQTVAGTRLSYTIPVADLSERIVLKPTGEEKLIDELNRKLIFDGQMTPRINLIKDGLFAQLLSHIDGLALMTQETKMSLDQYKAPGQLDLLLTGEIFMDASREKPQRVISDLLVEPNTGKSAWIKGWRGYNNGRELRGDMTAFNMIPLAGAYAQALVFGRWNYVERYWDTLKRHFSAVDFNQPWRSPGMNTLTSGLIVFGDMYGDGFRCYNVMYRLARGMKDDALAKHCLYLAAKQNMSTINLINPDVITYNAHVKNTASASSPNAALKQLGVDQYGFVTGPWRPFGKKAWNAPFQTAGCMIYDYPFFGTLLRFMHRDSTAWLDTFAAAIPEWAEPAYRTLQNERTYNAWNYLKYLAFASRDKTTIRSLYKRHFTADYSAEKCPFKGLEADWRRTYFKYLPVDWTMRANVLPHIIAQNDPVWIGDFGRAKLVSADYERAKRRATVVLNCDAPDQLTIISMIKPEHVRVNGKIVSPESASWEYEYIIRIPAGNSTVTLQVPEFEVDDYDFPKAKAAQARLQLPKAPEAQEITTKTGVSGGAFATGKCIELDLRRYCTAGFSDSPPNARTKEFWLFPKGETIIRGVPFNFIDPEQNKQKSTIFLRGKHRQDFPAEVRGIPVNRVVKRIFFLHGMCYNPANGKVMTYRLNFSDGQTRDIDIFAGHGVGEWKVIPGTKRLPDLPAALGGTHYAAARKGQWGGGAGGYVYVWNNNVQALGTTNQAVDQQGLARLSSIDIISAGQAIPIVFAITVEE
jgi:hypothetical protein